MFPFGSVPPLVGVAGQLLTPTPTPVPPLPVVSLPLLAQHYPLPAQPPPPLPLVPPLAPQLVLHPQLPRAPPPPTLLLRPPLPHAVVNPPVTAKVLGAPCVVKSPNGVKAATTTPVVKTPPIAKESDGSPESNKSAAVALGSTCQNSEEKCESAVEQGVDCKRETNGSEPEEITPQTKRCEKPIVEVEKKEKVPPEDVSSAPCSDAGNTKVEKDSTIPLKKQAQVATIRCAHPDRLKYPSARCHPRKPTSALPAPSAATGEKPPLARKNGLPSGVGTHRASRAQLSPLPQPVDTVPTLTPSPPSSASWAASPETLTSPMSASMFFANSSMDPQMSVYVDAAEDSRAMSCWGEQPPDLVTAANCMESFMDLKQYCNTSAFTEQPEGELNTPVIDLTKEPNFDLPSRTVPGNDSVDYSWRFSDTMGLNENYDMEGWKETEEANTPAEEMNTTVSDNNNNNDDNNNNNVRSDYTASEYTQISPVHYAHDVTLSSAIMPVFTKSELSGTDVYASTTTTGDEMFLVVDREEVVPPVAEEVVVKNEGWLQSPSHIVKSEWSNSTGEPTRPAPARPRHALRVELPVPSAGTAAAAVQLTPGTTLGDLFQSVPQDFDLLKFLLEDGMPEEVPDLLAPPRRDGWVPDSSSDRVTSDGEKTASLPERNDFPAGGDGAGGGGTAETEVRQQDGTALPDSSDSGEADQHQKLQLVIRKTCSPDSHDSPSYAVVQRPQRAASKRVLQAIKEELQDDFDEEDYLPDDSEYGDDFEPDSSDGRRTTGRKRQAPRATRRERSKHEPPRQRRRTVSTSSADDIPICRRYRELRDKNNEASRKSRENRKQREAEMQEQRERLERENARLKVRAEELERLVDALRKALVSAVSTSAGRRGTAEVED